MGLDMGDVSRLGKDAQQQIAAKLAVTLVESEKHMERRSKYNAQKTPVEMENGETYRFHSKAEAKRFRELQALMRAGKIRNLKLQPHYTLQEAYMRPTGEKVKREEYVADFEYEECLPYESQDEWLTDQQKSWRLVVEDVKGVRTPMYLRKKNAMLDKYGIAVREV